MFKSILPSKRLPDSDFFMVTPTSPTEGSKENFPALAPATNTTKTRVEKPRKSKTKDATIEPVAMEQAFDKLLVSPVYTCHRPGDNNTVAGRPSNSRYLTTSISYNGNFCESSDAQVVRYAVKGFRWPDDSPYNSSQSAKGAQLTLYQFSQLSQAYPSCFSGRYRCDVLSETPRHAYPRKVS